ncbi:MAG: SDR family oxidoreductase [Haliea sp.]|jgi:NAD(P)-dependent dehydrogenase (short-subunit alcohol dehydrogenase family)|nr:SDR family oxidoreductase [Haliea sp.]
MRFSDKTVLVTGAGSGIGLAAARAFLAEGATVIATDLHVERLEAISAEGEGELVCRVSDAGNCEAIAELAGWIADEYGRLDVLVNNAGFAHMNNPEQVDEGEYDAQMAVLLKGPVFYVKHLAALLRESGNGSVVNISSASALISPQGYCPYGLAKAAIHKFTEDCVVQVPGVRHNTIMPGFIETAILLDAYGEEATAQIAGVAEAVVPARRMGKPEDIASAVLFLASDEASYINGTNLVVDGGMARLNTAVSTLAGEVQPVTQN